MKALVETLVQRYGETNRQRIEDDVNKIEAMPGSWSLHEVYRHFENLSFSDEDLMEVDVEHASSATLANPSLRTASGEERDQYVKRVNALAFTQRTQLNATVIAGQGQAQYCEVTNDSGGLHAEQKFMLWADKNWAEYLRQNPEIHITLNNSPCLKICTPALCEWVQRHGLTQVAIHFINPYGESVSFKAAIALLRDAGIHVQSVNPLRDLIGDETEDALGPRNREGYEQSQKRVKKFKLAGDYASSAEEDISSSDEKQDSSSSDEMDAELEQPLLRAARGRGTRGRGRPRSTRASSSTRPPVSSSDGGGSARGRGRGRGRGNW